MNKFISLISCIIFGVGLVISEMINPEKVLGFLDIFGNWDPSLAFVMIGALIVSSPMFHLLKKRQKPIFENEFMLGVKSNICPFFFNFLIAFFIKK